VSVVVEIVVVVDAVVVDVSVAVVVVDSVVVDVTVVSVVVDVAVNVVVVPSAHIGVLKNTTEFTWHRRIGHSSTRYSRQLFCNLHLFPIRSQRSSSRKQHSAGML